MNDDLRMLARRREVADLSDGSTVELSALTIRDFAELQSQALAYYRRELIKAWASNADLLPDEHRDALVRQAFERAANVTLSDLPGVQTVERRPVDREVDGQKKIEMVEVPVSVEYVPWWMDKTYDGLLYTTWLAARRCSVGLTLDQWSERLSGAFEDVRAVANVVVRLSFTMSAGAEGGQPDPRMRRERRRKRGRR